MKKTHLLLIVSAIFISGLFNSSLAQYSQFNVGFEGGPSATSLRTSDETDDYLKSNFGFLTGVFGQFNFNQNYALKMAVNYQLKGSKLEFDVSDGYGNTTTLSGKFKMDYITIPLLFKGTFGSNVKFFVNAGPYLGILLTNTASSDENEAYNVGEESQDITDDTESTEFGITGGVGLQLPVSKNMSLTFEFRDDIGLTDVDKGSSVETKTNAASLVVGLSFSVGNLYGVKKRTN